MVENSFEERVFKIYNRWTYVNVFIADVALIIVLLLFRFGLWQVVPFVVLPVAYTISWGSPSRHVWRFIEMYMVVGEPLNVCKLFMEKVRPRFGGFGIWSPWKDFDAVFV